MRKCAGGSRKSPKIVIYVYSAVCMNLSIPSLEPTFLLGGILPDFFVVAQSPCCVWLFETPGYPHHLPEFAQVHVHFKCCHATVSSSDALFSFCPQSFPRSGTFSMSCPFASDDKNPGDSASASVFPVNIQSWSPLRLTDLISLLLKGLSGVFSSTTVWGH